MKRNIESSLLEWKDDTERKVLLVRGARQVGKTYSIRNLGKTFKYFIEVNFEEDPKIRLFFKDSLNPFSLCEKLSAYYDTPVSDGDTLLFLDEIQACPEALSSLRFFHEKRPGLHVVGAGSLLELVLSEIPSMGVGRISSLFMYPMTFGEYLMAVGEDGLSKVLSHASPAHPLEEPFHRRLVEHVRTYQLLGGMPSVLKSYVEKKNIPACFGILDDLIVIFQDDFSKYKRRVPSSRLFEVFRSLAFQAGGKFKYSNVDSESCSQSIRDALHLLVLAGLAYLVRHTDARGLPLGAGIDDRKFKAMLFDIGIHQRLLGLDVPRHLTANELDLVNKGSLAEVFAGLELIAGQSPHRKPSLHYWHREARGSNAEVDYVLQQGAEILPVEVKAGTKGQMQSLFLFMNERKLSRGLRVSLENFSKYGPVEVIPLYAVSRILS